MTKRITKTTPPAAAAALLGGKDHPILQHLLQIVRALMSNPGLVTLITTILQSGNIAQAVTQLLGVLDGLAQG